MDILYQIWIKSLNVTMEFDGTEWNFDDLCAKQIDTLSQPCDSYQNGLFSFFQFNPSLWSNQSSIQNIINKYQPLMQVYKYIYTYISHTVLTIAIVIARMLVVFNFCLLYIVSVQILYCITFLTYVCS